ncbi:MAG TPA: ATP-binding protein [Chloroflexota bacterium]|nr:ATP-binding protein [Chloroflexota bacterium]
MPLRWQIGGLVLVGLVIVFSLFGLLGSAIARDGRQRTVNEWLSITTSTAGFLDAEIEQQFRQLERAAALVADALGDSPQQRQTLSDALGQPQSFVRGAFLLDHQGRVIWSQSIDAAALADYIQAHPHALDPLTTDSRYASGVDTLAGQPAALLAVPVLASDGQAIGVLGEVMSPNQGLMRDLIASAHGLARTGHAELVDQYDRVLASSEPDHVLGPGEHPDFYEPLLAQHKSAVGLTAPVAMTDPMDQSQRHVMAFVPLNSVPWGLALGGSEAELAADTNRWEHQIALFGGITLLLALGLVWLTTGGVARPIEALTTASRRIAGGDLDTPIPHEGEGEVRVLAQAFDEMRNDLQGALSALALEKSRYEGIVGSMADAVFTTDLDLRITAFNPAASALTGWQAEEVLGRPCCEIVCSKEKARDPHCLQTCPLRNQGADLGVSKDVIETRDGRQVHVAVTRSAIRDQDGRLAGIVHVLRDISAEEELNRLKDEFLSTVSHELRTPLGFIKGYATTLLLPDPPDDQATTRHCIEVISEASDELEELVDNLLDMTKIGAGTLSVSPSPTRLRPLVHAAMERIRVRAQGHHFLMVGPASLPLVWADAHRVEQVLYNLLDNAIKYSPGGGHIAVKAEAIGQEAMVSVLDEGMGIPGDELPTLFERFHRGKAARARQIGGTGLGLAICKGIVEAHGGRIWAESPPADRPPGQAGTAIRFTLPVAPSKRRQAAGSRVPTGAQVRGQA